MFLFSSVLIFSNGFCTRYKLWLATGRRAAWVWSVEWLDLFFVLYCVGLIGILLNRRNFLITMLTIELMYLGVVSSFILLGTVLSAGPCLVYGLLLLILAACESAIGLGILIVLYKFEQSVSFTAFEELGG